MSLTLLMSDAYISDNPSTKHGIVTQVTLSRSNIPTFLNSYEDAVELFEKRGNIYSDGHKTIMLELEGWPDWFTSVMPYGAKLHKARQYFNKMFQRSVVTDYYDTQTRLMRKLLLKLLHDPDNFRGNIRHAAADSTIKIAYGYEIEDNDPNVAIINDGVRAVTDAMMFYLVNALPALRYIPAWFPGAHFQNTVREGRRMAMIMSNEPAERAKAKMADGSATPSMLSKLLDLYSLREQNESGDTFIEQTVAVAFAAGGDTTVAVLLTFVLAMVLYPDVMKKGQEELDRVIGRKYLPTFEDRHRLPYVQAICKESLRAILRDPKRYPDPENFMPERWLVEDGVEPPLDPNKVIFGFGRRICPGRFFAENSAFIGIASILSVFDMQKAVDERGVPIVPDGEYIAGIVRHPKPFKCKITPRSEEAIAVIHEATSFRK